MFKQAIILGFLALLPGVSYGEEKQIFTEDFDSGLGAWTIERQPYVDPEPDVMGVFPPGGAGMYGPRNDRFGVWGDSQCVGHSSNSWEGTTDHWIQKQWPGQLAPGTYTVRLEYDMYVYVDNITRWPGGGNWAVGNRVYLLTDEDYNYPCFDFDNGDPSPGFSISYWPGWDNYAEVSCQDVGGGTYRCVGGGNDGQPCTDENGDPSDDLCTWGYNGVWRRVTWDAALTTTTGNLELRLLKHEKDWDQQTVAWDDVDLVIKNQSDETVFEFHDSFDAPDPLAGWQNVMSCREPVSNNDQPQLFASNDTLLYDNIDNPGSQAAGYSSYQAFKDKTGYAWMKRLFPSVLPAGTVENPTVATMKLEFDWYVYDRLPGWQDNDSPTVFPAPDGAGIHGPNGAYPGSVSVGYSSNLLENDGIRGTWIQRQFPGEVDPGTYNVVWTIDRYVYSENDSYGNRIVLLTDQLYDDPTCDWEGDLDPDGDETPEGIRKSYWNYQSDGDWRHDVYNLELTTDTGNIEVRLISFDDTGGGPQTAAWDNMTLEFRDQTTDEVVFSVTDDFEDGLDGWTAMVNPNDTRDPGDPWWVGTEVLVLTDDLYNESDPDVFSGGGFEISRWPGDEPDLEAWDFSYNGHWRHWVVEQDFTTVTGNIDVRLLTRQKYSGKPEVSAWDNVKLSFVLPCNPVRFDADADDDVDQHDFAVFQVCYTGDGEVISDREVCRCMDSDYDGASGMSDVDVIDLQAFKACASGPDIPADVACDDQLPPPPPL